MKYKKNFLSKVVLKFDFAPVASLMSDKRTPFSDQIKDRFPSINAVQAATFQFTFGPAGNGLAQLPKGWVWNHTNIGGDRMVILSPESLAVEYGGGQYVDFAEFRGTVEYVLAALAAKIGVNEFTRIGLRYIDEIDLPDGSPLDWNGIVGANLATSLKAGMIDGLQMTRSMHQLTAVCGDVSIIFNYGINNPDFPSPVARRLFVLDYDAFIIGGVSFNEAVTRITALNGICERMFEASIEDGLRTIMEIDNGQQ